jgi:alpha-amylase/alpha-mannosidase (GH57 family)
VTDIRVAFLWHMHQPGYRDPAGGGYILPFVRLHGTKGYYDMARLSEEFPAVRVTVNLVPSLIAQIKQYAEGTAKDVFVDLTLARADDLTPTEKFFVIKNFFMNRWDTHVTPYSRYRELLFMRGSAPAAEDPRDVCSRFSDRDIRDLQVLFNLTWTGHFVRRDFPEIGGLIKKGRDFTEQDKETVIGMQREVMKRLIGLYRKLYDDGTVELSTSPFYHPILPLLIDNTTARRALPGLILPRRFAHPEDARWQINAGMELFAETFGRRPRGLWPSEGSVCPEMIPMLSEAGIRWIATDQDILFNSRLGGDSPADLYAPYRAMHDGAEVSVAFRDKKLSDLISFSYSQNDPQVAAADFMRLVQRIGEGRSGRPALITVALDGENPWEGYMDAGEGFLRHVYSALSEGAVARSTTIGDYLNERHPSGTIDPLFSGSWINHNFAIWIGHPEDNTAWDAISLVRDYLARFDASSVPEETIRRAWEEIYAAEGSDWFWWFGDDFSTEQAEEFDYLFRERLRNVYRLLGQQPPQLLSEPIKGARRVPETRPPIGFINPTIDGAINDFYEWANAGHYEVDLSAGVMYGGITDIESLFFGFSPKDFFIRIDYRRPSEGEAYVVHFFIRAGRDFEIVLPLVDGQRTYTLLASADGGAFEEVGRYERAGVGKIAEFFIPFDELGLKPGQAFSFFAEIRTDGVSILRCPRRGSLVTKVPDKNFELENWSV